MGEEAAEVEAIRREVGQPVVDGDGHFIEIVPLVIDIVRDLAGPGTADAFVRYLGAMFGDGSAFTPVRQPFWGSPGPTIDRLTTALPALMHEQLGEIGIDFAVIDMRPEDVTRPDDDLVATYDRVYQAYLEFSKLLDERRANPGSDLASAMLAATDENGEPALSSDDVIAHMVGITAAGVDTTANLIVNMVRFFTEDHDRLQLVLDNPELWDNAVAEGLRRSAIANQLFRVSTRESVIAGAQLPARSKICVSIAGANSDPAKFPSPLRFDVRRDNAGDHLSFGRGRHYCLGAPLAPPEAQIALEALYRRLPNLRADLDQQLEFMPSVAVRGIMSQRVIWDA